MDTRLLRVFVDNGQRDYVLDSRVIGKPIFDGDEIDIGSLDADDVVEAPDDSQRTIEPLAAILCAQPAIDERFIGTVPIATSEHRTGDPDASVGFINANVNSR